MNKLLIITFLFIAVQDSTKVDTTMKPMVSIFEERSEIQKMENINNKLDSILIKLQKRKNDTLNLKL